MLVNFCATPPCALHNQPIDCGLGRLEYRFQQAVQAVSSPLGLMAVGFAQGRSGSGFLSACAGAANGSTAANPSAATAICKGIDRIMSPTSEQRRWVPQSPALWPQQL